MMTQNLLKTCNRPEYVSEKNVLNRKKFVPHRMFGWHVDWIKRSQHANVVQCLKRPFLGINKS